MKRKAGGSRDSFAARISEYATGNQSAARIIYAEAQRYDGLPLTWACLVLGKPRPDFAVQGFFSFSRFEQRELWHAQ